MILKDAGETEGKMEHKHRLTTKDGRKEGQTKEEKDRYEAGVHPVGK